jgi:hypothetical protein
VLEYIPTYTIIRVNVYKLYGDVLLECKDVAVDILQYTLCRPSVGFSDCYQRHNRNCHIMYKCTKEQTANVQIDRWWCKIEEDANSNVYLHLQQKGRYARRKEEKHSRAVTMLCQLGLR